MDMIVKPTQHPPLDAGLALVKPRSVEEAPRREHYPERVRLAEEAGAEESALHVLEQHL